MVVIVVVKTECFQIIGFDLSSKKNIKDTKIAQIDKVWHFFAQSVFYEDNVETSQSGGRRNQSTQAM